jgi:hypothetical protein
MLLHAAAACCCCHLLPSASATCSHLLPSPISHPPPAREEVQQAAKLCADAGAWLLLDNTYEDFVYGGREHYADPSANVVHVFSMSKVPDTVIQPQAGVGLKPYCGRHFFFF